MDKETELLTQKGRLTFAIEVANAELQQVNQQLIKLYNEKKVPSAPQPITPSEVQ